MEVTYPVHDKLRDMLHDAAYDESNLCGDGTLSALTAVLCENDIPHSFTVKSQDGMDWINLWFEELQKEFHFKWYEEKSMKYLEEED